MRTRHAKTPSTGLAVAALTLLAAPGLGRATTVVDPVGDLLSTLQTFEGDTSDHSDLDVVSASATRDATNVYLSSTQAGDVGLTRDGIYVWGVNRGSGFDILNSGDPPVGAGVDFDTFIVLHQDGKAEVNLIDIVDGAIKGIRTPISLDPGAVTISGRTISVAVPLSLLPTAGFQEAAYRYNVWPRYLDTATTRHVADFAPDNSTFTASVPEPAAWALMITGFGLSGGMLRRRSRLAAA